MLKKGLSEQEKIDLLDTLMSTSSYHSHIILLLLLTGLRTEELLYLKVKDLDLTSTIATLSIKKPAKRSLARRVGIKDVYRDRLVKKIAKSSSSPEDKLIKALGYGGDCLDNGETVKAVLRRSWQNMKKKVWGSKAPDLGLHSLRHTWAITAYSKTRDPLLVQHGLGHKSFSSTQVYLNYYNQEEEIKKMSGFF